MSFEDQMQDTPEQMPLSASEWSILHEAGDLGDISKIIAEAHAMGCHTRALETFKRDIVAGEVTVLQALHEAPTLSAKDWDRLLALWLYDAETAHHTLRTYGLVHRILCARPELAQAIVHEGVPLKEEKLAAILHDVGKLCIPRSVLNNTLSQAEAKRMLVEKLSNHDAATLRLVHERFGSTITTEHIEDALEQRHVRPIHVLPLEYVVTPEEEIKLQHRGFETKGKTLMDIIGQHEKFSGILLDADHPIAANIAAHHHTPHESRYTTSAAVLGTTSRLSAELVTAVDEIDAISFQRAYKKAEPLTQALTNELRRYREGRLSSFVTYHVLSELLGDIPQEEREAFSTDVNALAAFIAEHEARTASHQVEVGGERLAA